MNIKTLFLVCFILTFFNIVTFGQAKDKIAKIVIDAGHGGSAPGSVGKQCKEKDINIKVARRLGKLISDNYEDVTVIYTRKGDETVEIYRRAEIANKNKADLFLSIHCNSVKNKPYVKGVETFVMGVGKSEENMAVAKNENADILLEKDYEANYSGFDPNSPEANIVFSLYSSAYLNSSTILASKVQKHLVTNTGLMDRKVKQDQFLVLYKVAMPSILIELGFISNIDEEKYLLRPETQELMAVSIYNAFVEYKNLLEGTNKSFLPTKGEKMVVTEVAEVEGFEEILETAGTAVLGDNKDNGDNENNGDTKDTIVTPVTPVTPVTSVTSVTPVTPVTPVTNIRFRIQFFISKENISPSDKKFIQLSEVKKYNESGVWKYTSGDFKTLAEAQSMLPNVKKLYQDAFIIAFQNEQKISVQEAEKIIQQTLDVGN